ncbi:3'(2'),5'-bisphosphate nucleotidase CysQ [Rickettsiales bacterium]|nr:3'(2'),5'-bisphosphate nucleotidase CysQ [Rickettsiales bacterium]
MIYISDDLVDSLIDIIQVSGEIVLGYYGKSKKKIKFKTDNTPITEADTKTNKYICKKLSEKFPDVPIISEEGYGFQDIDNRDYFFLVDPLDGTKEFINGTDEFTINIALIKNKKPVIGVINVPSKEQLYWTDGSKSFLKDKDNAKKIIKTRKFDKENMIIEVSKSHLDHKTLKFINEFNTNKLIKSGSSIKLCNIASGKSSIYPRFGSTMEWDIAAGHAILSNSGGQIFDEKGNILKYCKKGYRNRGFIAISQKKISNSIFETVRNL